MPPMAYSAIEFLQDRSDDLRFALRTMRRGIGFTAVAVLSLALGIGANTAIFSLIDAILLKSLPVKDPHQLYVVTTSISGRVNPAWNHPDFVAIRENNHGFEGTIAYSGPQPGGFTSGSTSDSRAELATGIFVSGNYFDVLGVRAAIGTLFNAEHDRKEGAAPYIVLSHDFWQRRFASDPRVIGSTLRVNGFPLQVIGVTRTGFTGVEVGVAPDFFTPVMMRTELTGRGNWNNRNNQWLLVLGRIKPGATVAQLETELTVINKEQELRERRTTTNPRFVNEGRPVKLEPGAQGYSMLRNRLSEPLVLLMIIVGVVLLIACANVANLLLARAAARRHEIAVRLAVGASRIRIMSQLLTESVLLGLIGGIGGLIFAYAGVRVLLGFLPQNGWVDINLDVNPDFRLLAFTVGTSFLTGLIFGLAPALQGSRPEILPELKEEKGATVSRSKFRLRKALVVAQVALCLLLLIGAGLFVRSLQNLKTLDAGFRPDNTLIVDFDPSRNGYTGPRLRDFYERLRERLETAPGVNAVSLAHITPLGGSRRNQFISIDSYNYTQGERRVIDTNAVGPRFFETMAIPILLGRDFRQEDSPAFTPEPPIISAPPDGSRRPEDLAGPHVAIVNEALAKKYLQNRNPIGARLSISENYQAEGSYEIVGVVRDARYFGLRSDTEPMVYVPVWRQAVGARTLTIRTSNDPKQFIEIVRREASAIDSAIPLLRARTMEQQIDNNILQEKLVATLAGFFGVVALLLASIGLYGVMAYAVTNRTREIGIRMALGADRPAVLWLVLRDAFVMVVAGAVIGLPAALAITKYAGSLLYGVAPRDAMNAALATTLLMAVALAASYLPARRASHIEPTEALRSE